MIDRVSARSSRERPGVHDVPAVDTRARADVDDPVGRVDRLLVVLDDDQGVAEVAQREQGLDEAPVVALMQPDGGLIEHVEHSGEARADLGREADALRLAAGQRAGRAAEAQVVEADLQQEVEPSPDLAQHLRRDLRFALGQLELCEILLGVGQAETRRIGDRVAVHQDGEDLRLEPVAVARQAGHFAQVLRPTLALRIGVGLHVLSLDVRHDALEARGVPHLPAVAVLPLDGDLVVLPAEDRLLHVESQIAPRSVERELQVGGEPFEEPLVVLEQSLALRRPGNEDALPDRQLLVGQHEVDVHRHARAEAGAGRACAERCVERERARLDLGELQGVAVRARELLGERLPRGIALLVDEVDLHDAAGKAQRRLDGIGDAAQDVGAGDESVDDDGDVVLVALLQHRRLGELNEFAVDDGACVALRRQLLEQVDELPLLLGDDRRDDLVARLLGQLHQLVGDLLHRLPLDHLAALRAVRDADARPEETHVVVDLGDRADRRARVAVRRLLVDGHRGAETLDEVDVGTVDLSEELTRVRAERFDVPALPFSEDRVERKAGLARAAEPREHDERIPRNIEVDVLQIVDAGTSNGEGSARVGMRRDGNNGHPSSLGGASDTRPGFAGSAPSC